MPGEQVVFIDTSALLKAYISEEGSGTMDAIFDEDAARATSSIGFPEAVSVFKRLHSVEKALSDEQFKGLSARLLADASSGRLSIVGVMPHDLETAIALLMKQHLTAIDALHVALAMGMGPAVVFVSSDEKPGRVARESGLNVLVP